MPTKKPAKTTPAKLRPHKPTEKGTPQLYILEVFVISGPITEKFAKASGR